MVNDRDDSEHRTAWGPRLLAPLAFFAAVTVLALLVQSSLSARSKPEASATTGSFATVPTTTGTTTVGNPAKRKMYRIKQGDTLEAIALRFDTTVDDLITLNPNIEANALEPGTRIRIQ
jgi:LysM repeat protein